VGNACHPAGNAVLPKARTDESIFLCHLERTFQWRWAMGEALSVIQTAAREVQAPMQIEHTAAIGQSAQVKCQNWKPPIRFLEAGLSFG